MPSRSPNVRAIRATAAGGPDVLELTELPDPEPAADVVLVRVAAAGVNFIDTYRRSGVYTMTFPHVVGSEGAGTVVAVGSEVSEIAEERPDIAKYWSAPTASFGGSHCDYDGGSIRVYQGKVVSAIMELFAG